MKRAFKSHDFAHRAVKIRERNQIQEQPRVPSGYWKDNYWQIKKLFPFILLFLCHAAYSQSQYITTIAGTGTAGFSGDGGKGTLAEVNNDRAVAIDTSGNVYICDVANARLRKLNTAGIITTIGGNGYGTADTGDGGPATAASIRIMFDVAADRYGNIYVSEGGDRIRKINAAGIITTAAGHAVSAAYGGDGGPATAAGFSAWGIGVDDTGNLYIADIAGLRIRKVSTAGIITTVAGSGTSGSGGDGMQATAAQLTEPTDVAVDKAGNIYIADKGTYRIRKVTPAGIISTFAGTGISGETGDGGPATAADVVPGYIATDDSGNVYYSSNNEDVVRKINTSGIIVTVAGVGVSPLYNGDGIPATSAHVGSLGIAVDKKGSVYMADYGNSRVRKTYSHTVSTPIVSKGSETLNVWPNPTSGQFTINMSSPTNETVQVTITNMVGETVKELTITTNKETVVPLHAPPGVYFISAVNSSGRQVSKVIIQ